MTDDSTERWRQKPLDFKLDMLRNMDALLQLEAKKQATMLELKRALIGHWMLERIPEPNNVDPRWLLRMVRTRLKSIDNGQEFFYLDRQVWHVDEANYCIEWLAPILDKRDTRTFLISAQIRQEIRRHEIAKQREEY